MATATDTPFLGTCFEVTADGTSIGSFSECSGLTVDVGSEEYHEGGQNHFVHRLPTYASTQAVVLKRGLTCSSYLWDWIRSFVDRSVVEPRRVQISLRTHVDGNEPVRTWIVDHAYPVKWEGPKLDATRGEIAFESVELAHRGVSAGR